MANEEKGISDYVSEEQEHHLLTCLSPRLAASYFWPHSSVYVNDSKPFNDLEPPPTFR